LLAADDARPAGRATLGAEFRYVTADEAMAYGLAKVKVCVHGLYLTTLVPGGPAAKTGLKEGDVLLALDASRICSLDDVEDFLRVSPPGRKVRAVVKRAGTFKEEAVPVTLAPGKGGGGNSFTWDYAGLGQLEAAVATAKKDGKLVLVGLSGADT
jgi:S1-C subfamily serine protease